MRKHRITGFDNSPLQQNELIERRLQLTCTTSSAGADLSPYSKPFTKPNSMGARLLVGRSASF